MDVDTFFSRPVWIVLFLSYFCCNYLAIKCFMPWLFACVR